MSVGIYIIIYICFQPISPFISIFVSLNSLVREILPFHGNQYFNIYISRSSTIQAQRAERAFIITFPRLFLPTVHSYGGRSARGCVLTFLRRGCLGTSFHFFMYTTLFHTIYCLAVSSVDGNDSHNPFSVLFYFIIYYLHPLNTT